MPHKFINSGEGPLRQTSIHPNTHMILENKHKVLDEILRKPVTFGDARAYTSCMNENKPYGEDIQSVLHNAHRPKV